MWNGLDGECWNVVLWSIAGERAMKRLERREIWKPHELNTLGSIRSNYGAPTRANESLGGTMNMPARANLGPARAEESLGGTASRLARADEPLSA